MNTFYNIAPNGHRFSFPGEILYNFIKYNYDNELKLETITDTGNDFSKYNINDETDYVYYNYDYKDNKLSNHITGRDNKFTKYTDKSYQYKKFSKVYFPGEWCDSSTFLTTLRRWFNKYDELYITMNYGYSGLFSYVIKKTDSKIIKDIFSNLVNDKINLKAKISRRINKDKIDFSQNIILFKDGYLHLDNSGMFIHNDVNSYGNYFPIKFTIEQKQKINKIVAYIANQLVDEGVLGVVGFDMMMDGEDIYVSEMNPNKTLSNIIFSLISLRTFKIPIPVLEYFACSGESINNLKDKYLLQHTENDNYYCHLKYVTDYKNIDNIIEYKLVNNRSNILDIIMKNCDKKKNTDIYYYDTFNNKRIVINLRIDIEGLDK